MELIKRISNTKLKSGQVAVVWLGQAGFLIKIAKNKIIVIDPYLSNCVEREFGFKRLSASVVEADKLKSDILIVTHEHLDHFDIDSMPVLIRNTRERIISSPAAAEMFKELKSSTRILGSLTNGQSVEVGDIKIRAVYADHGDLAPDSIGVLIETDDFTIYYSSDTSYRPKEITASLGCNPDIAILPINGMYGNLNSIEAAKLAEVLKIKNVIPCHFWTFREHNGEYGDPLSFERAMKQFHKKGRSLFLTPGEILIIEEV